MSLVEKARKHLTDCRHTEIPFLHIFSGSDKEISMPQTQTPYIFFILDGELRLYTPGGIMDYVAGQYSVSAIDTPECGYVLAFSEQQDFLSAAVEFTANDMMNIVISLDDDLMSHIFADDLDDETKSKHDRCVFSCLERMLDTLADPLSMKFLCDQFRTEMLFHVLCGSCGKAFIQSITRLKSAGEIYEANSWIKQNYRQPFKVEELAELSAFCTCKNTKCPLHPTNHDKGCAPCIAKNLKLIEMPNCFFDKIEGSEKRKGDSFTDFADCVRLQSIFR